MLTVQTMKEHVARYAKKLSVPVTFTNGGRVYLKGDKYTLWEAFELATSHNS